MKKLLTLTLCLLMIFTFSSNLFAADTFYADEESADGTPLFDGITLFSTQLLEETADDGKLVIVLDPGHGGMDPGANPKVGLRECDLAIDVAKACKAYIEANVPNATVYLTHENYYNKETPKLELADRAAIAKSKKADLFISLHFNSSTDTTNKGAEVYISCLEEYALKDLADNVHSNLGDLGLEKRGVKTRASESGDLWFDGIRLADYYGIIRGNCKQEIPVILVEHCYINNPDEFEAYASTPEKLKTLGEADAKAIIKTFGLDKDTSADDLKAQKETALAELDKVYKSMDVKLYSQYYREKMVEIYNDAKHRIEIATHSSKIDVNLNRALLTLKYYPTLPFTDVTVDDWFFDAVSFVTNNELFYGTSEDTFSPNRPITRGEFITVIGRMEQAEVYYPAPGKFTDVDPEAYYAPYINWATNHKIVAGISETKFAPKDDIRREDLIRMIHNFCITKEIELPVVSESTIKEFTDGNQTDTWAVDDVNWALSVGLIHGYEDNTIRPTRNITRAESAEIMKNFLNTITK
ncbi:MAG: S-layer homology domain-containing protein [Firmicutes bacterium]|nr:S-layer homology domain-containing protein [Bacillota bacterium]